MSPFAGLYTAKYSILSAFTAHGRLTPFAVAFAAKSAAARARTWDNLGNNQVLYQLSYGGSILSNGSSFIAVSLSTDTFSLAGGIPLS